jgi:hypothetical protein
MKNICVNIKPARPAIARAPPVNNAKIMLNTPVAIIANDGIILI